MEENQQNTVQLPGEEAIAIEESSLSQGPALTAEEEDLLREMMETAVFYGRSKARTNPLMKEHVLVTRAGFEVIDLKQTLIALQKASEFIKGIKEGNGLILLVGTSPAA
ncbi:MAG: 30S ribosomal protein S2, partial [Candidatus Colwellbacteria bacterium]|nr:30S ribosomal protein S2 [Candidatus Colwellbacteria bacterium]